MSSADLHDSQMGAVLIQGDEEAYYADKAYDSQALRDELADRGIKDRIAYKARRGKKQPNWQKWMNKAAASMRSGIERTNATQKNWYGMAGPLSRPGAQPLPSAACRLRAQRQTGARSHQGQSGLRGEVRPTSGYRGKIGTNEPKVSR